jgi:hypothetical protein
MFYDPNPSGILRLGDIVQGFPLTATGFSLAPDGSQPEDFRVEVRQPPFAAVLSPCCSIGSSTVLLSPLLTIERGWFANDYFVLDFTNLNRPMTAEQALPRDKWDKLTPDEREKRLDVGKPGGSYAYLEQFIYAPHDLLPVYHVRWKGEDKQVGHYMVDFRRTYKVECPHISYPQNERSPVARMKRLQLSVESRGQLRDKLSYFYGNPPSEDAV